MAFQYGQTIRGNTDWDQNPELQSLQAMAGQKLGDWKTDANGMYIDTQWGRIYDNLSTQTSRDPQGDTPWEGPQFGGQANLGVYANQHGSDKVYAQIDKDGVLQSIGTNRESPRDRNKFLLAAAALVTAGAAYGVAGAAGGTTAGTTAAGTTTAGATGTSAAELAAMDTAMASGGYSGAATGTAAAGGGTASMSAGELAAMDAAGGAGAGTGAAQTGAPIAQSAARTAGSTRNISTAQNLYESLFSGSTAGNSGLWERVLAGMVSQGGQAIIDNNKRDEAIEDRDNQRAYDAALLADERAYKIRNMGADKMATVNWGLATVPKARPDFKPVNPFSEEAPPSVLNTPRLPPGPIQAPVIESAWDRYNRYGTPT